MDYTTDIAKYTTDIQSKAVDAIVKYCGIALQTRDASLVSVTDNAELGRVRQGFATKVLGLSEAEADTAIAAVAVKMKGENAKHRVTFYYLLAEVSGKLGVLS